MGQKIALIIGNSEYEDRSLARLIAPKADVTALANILRAPDIGGFDEVTTLVNESATTVRIAIARFFADKKRDDLLVLYFSGHGVLDERGQLYLAVKDTERTLPKGTALEASFITDVMDSSNSRRQVLILDCCHSGAFARGAKGTPGASVHTGTAFEGIGTGRVVLTATDATQYAWEGDQVVGQAETSVFTRYLIQGLQTGEADSDVDGNITLDELYDYAYSQVVTETPKQTPGKWSYRQQGDIVIARNPRPLAKQVALPAEIQQSIDDSRPWVREGVIDELNRLLNGRNLALSQAAHEALKRLAEDDSRKVAAAAAQSLNGYEAGLRAEAERVEEQPREPERFEAEHLAAEKAKPEVEAEQLAAQTAEEERRRDEKVEQERLEAERLAALKVEEEHVVQAKAKQETLARERAEVPTALPLQPRGRFTRKWILSGLIVLGVLAGLYLIMSGALSGTPASTPSSTPIRSFAPAVTATSRQEPSPTSKPGATPAPSDTPQLAPALGETRIRSTDGMTMVYVPAGTFKMGSATGEADEKPVHDVTLDAFWVDRTDVTNAAFKRFVADTGYRTDAEKAGTGLVYDASKFQLYERQGADWQHPKGPDSNLDGRDDHPVVQVSWNDANAYCQWAGGQLPTEAQWEYAARGPQSYAYPWGNGQPNDKLLNYSQKVGDTTVVGSYPRGVSWVGALDMAGNVWNWVQDWYGPYPDSPQTNPVGPASGQNRGLRGGSWFHNASSGGSVRSADRNGDAPPRHSNAVGFRCMVASGG